MLAALLTNTASSALQLLKLRPEVHAVPLQRLRRGRRESCQSTLQLRRAGQRRLRRRQALQRPRSCGSTCGPVWRRSCLRSRWVSQASDTLSTDLELLIYTLDDLNCGSDVWRQLTM